MTGKRKTFLREQYFIKHITTNSEDNDNGLEENVFCMDKTFYIKERRILFYVETAVSEKDSIVNLY